jgi:hypothetical protein
MPNLNLECKYWVLDIRGKGSGFEHLGRRNELHVVQGFQ